MRIIYFILLVPCLLFGQQPVPGQVSQSIAIPDSEGTYALYLPRTFDASKEYPAVFIFDPDGKGAQAAQQFVIAAELTGSIVLAPNLKIEALTEAVKFSEQFVNTMFDQWSIDRDQIFLTGRLDGAVLASSSAQLSSIISGVIAVGDVYVDRRFMSDKNGFKLVILSGEEGKHYYKLQAYDRAVRRNGFLKALYTYNGGDDWPEAGYMAAALSDLMLNGSTPEEKKMNFYESDLKFGELLFKRRRHLEAFAFVESLKSKYKPYLEIDEQKALLKTIRGNATFRAKRSQRNTAQLSEQLLIDDFTFYMQDDIENSFFDNLGWWHYQMEELEAKIDSTASNAQERRSSLRVKNYVNTLVEAAYDVVTMQEPSIEKRLYINVLRTIINPSNSEAFINTISLSAKEGDENAALFYLEELLKTGYSDYEQLYMLDGTTALRIGKEWNEIIKFYLGKSKYY